jgi:hypothetical protein
MPPAMSISMAVSTWPKPSRWCVRSSRGSHPACGAFRMERPGDRGNWIFFQMQKFLQLPWLVPARLCHPADSTIASDARKDHARVPTRVRQAVIRPRPHLAGPNPGYSRRAGG